ncbi:hypothetical protein C2G38_2093631 [Gigaspora rosea]|uniref:Replication origin-binding protein domain-containing protein n=1 Tax=Gigaspora rosea TaxID=44941 RepID=A0A397V1I5_9GLOM|nr:hypothetical protein C2G38_2093631 [Gigaspora rosea]
MAYKDQYIKTLPEIPDIYVGSPWGTGKTYALEKLNTPQNVSMLVVSTRHSYSNAITTRLNLESYCDIDGPIHLSLSNFFELIYNASRIIALDNDLTDRNIEWIKTLRPNKTFTVIHNTYQPQKDKTFRLAPFEERRSASLICHERRDVQGSVRGLRNDFPELRIKEYHGGSNL